MQLSHRAEAWLRSYPTRMLATHQDTQNAYEVLTYVKELEDELAKAQAERDEALRGVMDANRKRLEAKEGKGCQGQS